MQKEKFDNTGVAQVQATVLGLPIDEKSREIGKLRAGLGPWLERWFDLTSSQQAQLASLPTRLREEIAQEVADAWQDEILITFNKDGGGDDDDRGYKDILFERKTSKRHVFGDQVQHPAVNYQVSIWIKHR